MYYTVWNLWQDAARSILKKPVRVDFEQPGYRGASGECSLKDGRVYIRISPGITPGRGRIHVFLHELGHALFHTLDLDQAAPAGSKDISPTYSTEAPREVECDTFSARIMASIPKSELQGDAFEEHALRALIEAGRIKEAKYEQAKDRKPYQSARERQSG